MTTKITLSLIAASGLTLGLATSADATLLVSESFD